MKKLLIGILIATLVLGLCGCQAGSTSPSSDGGWAEILMPGNTLVTGHYDRAFLISENWLKIHLNGKWYATNNWRVVLMEEE